MSKPLRLKLKQKWLPYVYGYLARLLLKILGLTCRFRIERIENLRNTATNNKCILMFWHNRLGMITEILARCAPQFYYAAVISKSRDGEIISVLTDSYKHGRSIRVPHNARSGALQTMIRELKENNEILIITPDGPRGPRYQIKPGIAIAAREASAHVVPLSWSANRYWTFRTWDKLMLPKPFSTIHVTLGEPLTPGKSTKETMEALQESLMAIDVQPKNCEKTLP